MPSLAPTRARTVATSSASNDTTGKKPCRDPQPGADVPELEPPGTAQSGPVVKRPGWLPDATKVCNGYL